jgi:hypothetical protein
MHLTVLILKKKLILFIVFVARKNIIPGHEAVQSSCNIIDEWEQ